MKRPSPIALCFAICVAVFVASIGARFAQVDLENVPIDRLIANLEAILKDNPYDNQVRFNLARVHAMTYASKSQTADIPKNHPETGIWFGHVPNAVPFEIKPAIDPETKAEADRHLKSAIEGFQQVLVRDSMHVLARLGLAWCQQQAGDKAAAVANYRMVIEMSWVVDRQLRSAWVTQPITFEVIGYLIPLLDPARDRDEIATLRAKATTMDNLGRMVTPIAIPLTSRSGWRDVEAPDARVRFDADGSGIAREWSWIGPDAGWLVYNQIGDGKVTSSLQLFGGVTFWLFWENGYQALGALDDNHDGRISGAELAHLSIWRDRNGNGVTDPGELLPLADWNIVALSYRYQHDPTHQDEIAFAPEGVVYADGRTGPSYDVLLHRR